MSDIRPLRTLVEELRERRASLTEFWTAAEYQAFERTADELEALLDAHEAEIEARHHDPGEPQYFDGMMEAKAVREQILGARKP